LHTEGPARLPSPKNTLGRFASTQLTKAKPEIIIFWALKPADLAIEIPDFHVAAIHKLASGLHCLRVCIGIKGFVRRYAIVSIN
jgi:hypothetical protein